MSSKKKLFKNSGIYGIIQILQKGIGLIMLPIYTNLLTPENKGISDVVQSLVAFFAVFYTLSLNAAVVRYYIEYKDEPEKLKDFWGTCVTFVLVNSFIMSTLLFIFRDYILTPMAQGIAFWPYIALGVLAITLSPIYAIFQSTLQAKEESALYAKNNISYFLTNLGLNILFVVVLRFGALGVLLALAVTEGIFFIYTLIKFIPTITFKIKSMYLKQALKYSLPLLPHSLSGWAVSMIDKLFLNGFMGSASSGIYSTAAQFGNVINVFTTAVNQAYVPWFFEKMKEKSKNELEIVKVSEYIIIFYCFLATGMSLFGPEIFKIMVNSSYYSGWRVIPILSFAFVVNGIYYFFVNPLFYNKRGVKYIAIGTFTGAILNSILNIVLIPYFAEIGSAIASLIATLISCVLVYFIARKIEPIKFNVFKLFSITTGFFLVALSTYYLEKIPMLIAILVKIGIILILIALVLIIYRKDFKQLESIFEVIKNKIKK